jgi:hypothetical protein
MCEVGLRLWESERRRERDRKLEGDNFKKEWESRSGKEGK